MQRMPITSVPETQIGSIELPHVHRLLPLSPLPKLEHYRSLVIRQESLPSGAPATVGVAPLEFEDRIELPLVSCLLCLPVSALPEESELE